MSRLIDIEKITDDEIIDYLGSRYASCLDDVRNLLSDQPTAYNLEAVVRELEVVLTVHKKQYEEYGDYFSLGVVGGIKTAIEIVKRGGRNE